MQAENQRFEIVILENLIFNKPYLRRVLPFLKREYFREKQDGIIFDLIEKFVEKYKVPPTIQSLAVELKKLTTINESVYARCNDLLDSLSESEQELEWLVDETEEFCQTRAVEISILKSYDIISGEDKIHTKEYIPEMLKNALAVCFDASVGHDYFGDAESQYDRYSVKIERIPFNIKMLNTITNGGVPNKTLNVLMAPTGVGKSLCLCHLATSYLEKGKNVLYITLEMAEEMIRERVDANLLNLKISDIGQIGKSRYMSYIKNSQSKIVGNLIIKEYPTGGAHAGHFRNLLGELKMKKGFVPDVIIVDYLNICSSQRIKSGVTDAGYRYVKTIAEELRALAVESNVPLWSATQTNRGGYDNTDTSMTDTSESIGLPQTVDFMLAIIETDELRDAGQLLLKQLKNRYADPNKFRRFLIGVDKERMKLFDLEESAQQSITKLVDGDLPHPQNKPSIKNSPGKTKFNF